MATTLLRAIHDELDWRVMEGIQDGQVSAARVAEHSSHTLLREIVCVRV